MNKNLRKSSQDKNRPNTKVAFKVLEEWLRQFELVYNLSPELSKSQIEKLRQEFDKIL